MNYSNFRLRCYNDILTTYPNAQLESNLICIDSNYLEITISLEDAYMVYELACDYDLTIKTFIKNIEQYKDRHKFKIDHSCIYPSIRSKSFGKEEKFPFYRYDFCLDLDIFYIQDMGEMYKFLSNSDVSKKNQKDIKTKAFENLERTLNPLVQLEKGMDVYTYKYLSDLNAPRILLDSEINRITKILGDSFLVTILSTTTIFYAKDTSFYFDLLNYFKNEDPGEHKISNKIYRYNSGLLTYANPEEMFRIVK